MLTYGYCSVCNTMLLIEHLEEHREDHHPELQIIFLKLTSDTLTASGGTLDAPDPD